MNELKEEQEFRSSMITTQTQIPEKRICDFCGDSKALLYCRADSAKLCLSCDREVHSTNPLFTKHSRWLLCDACDSSPVSIFCFTDNSVLCQNCDWESHSQSLSNLHDRRPLEGFTGCPSVIELLGILGFEDVGKKDLLLGDDKECGDEDYGFSDYLTWDTPSIISLDDLIVSGDSAHNFQAMGVGVPPISKNRNAACGRHKEEIHHQLREMSKSEPNLSDGQGDLEPLVGFQSIESGRNHQSTGSEQNTEPIFVPSYEESSFQWGNDTGKVADEGLPSNLLGSYIETNCLVPDKDSDVGDISSHENGCCEGLSCHPTNVETFQVLPKPAARELSSQERETALSRYKEKKKYRRYDKHIRYESRKVRAENRTRIKGRFAKMDRKDIAIR